MLLPASQDGAGWEMGLISGDFPGDLSGSHQHRSLVLSPRHPEVLRCMDGFPASVLAPPASLFQETDWRLSGTGITSWRVGAITQTGMFLRPQWWDRWTNLAFRGGQLSCGLADVGLNNSSVSVQLSGFMVRASESCFALVAQSSCALVLAGS